MIERPILFSAPMVRATLARLKRQTRRVVKPQPPDDKQRSAWYEPGIMGWAPPEIPSQHWHRVRCPYGQPGDRLWVREAWAETQSVGGREKPRAIYRADEGVKHGVLQHVKWRPSIHMPRWASRITLEVTGVRVERLQDISEADAVAEGIELVPGPEPYPMWRHYGKEDTRITPASSSYETLWESINGPGSWDANPWVWVVEFAPLTTSEHAASHLSAAAK